MFRPEQSGRLLETNKISTSSALYTCNLQLTMCSSPPAAHLAQVTGLVPSGAAERSEAVKPGDLFHAVDGKDVTSLTDAQVAALCFGTPNTPLTLTLCGKAPPSQGKLYQGYQVLLRSDRSGGVRASPCKMTRRPGSAQSRRCW